MRWLRNPAGILKMVMVTKDPNGRYLCILASRRRFSRCRREPTGSRIGSALRMYSSRVTGRNRATHAICGECCARSASLGGGPARKRQGSARDTPRPHSPQSPARPTYWRCRHGRAPPAARVQGRVYERDLFVIDRWAATSRTCSACGQVPELMPLSVRTWACYSCGAEHDRNVNATIDI